MSNLYKIIFVLFAILAALFLGFYILSDVIAPFLAAFVIAYFAEPIVAKLEKWKIARKWGALIVIILLILFIVSISVTIFPMLYKQIVGFSHIALNNKDKIYQFINKYAALLNSGSEYMQIIQAHIDDFSYKILSYSGDALQRIARSSIGLVSGISFVFITPVVLFYTLENWPSVVKSIHELIPRVFIKDYNLFIKDLDNSMSGYIRGQAMDCFLMMIYYSLAYWFVGLESAFAIGLITGFFTFIPYIGVAIASIITVSIVITQFGTLDMLIVVIAIIVVGNIIEGYFIIPKFVGANMNVHPVWTIFGLLVGASLFGFWGMLFALPLTAITSVVIRFALRTYKVSKIYK